MAIEKVMAPEMKLLKDNEFYVFYEMMIQSLKTDNVKEGINKSFSLLRTFLNSGNILLFKKNKDGTYIFKISDSEIQDLIYPASCIINKTKALSEERKIFNLNLELSNRFQNMTIINTKVGDTDCIVAVLNIDKSKNLESLFWERLRETIQIILKRAASYERNLSAVSTDLLTGLDNRNSYEMRIQNLIKEDENLVVGVFDLFRLKHINDNYTHAKGDEYIKSVANILDRYWPKKKIIINDDLTESAIDTGHCIYRIGGDEFVLLTKVETLQLAQIKARLVKDEVNLINLDINDNVPLGLNYGIVKHNPEDTFKQTFMKADDLMQEEKNDMYKKYKLERRR